MENGAVSTKIVQLTDVVYAIDQGMVRSFLILGQEKALLLDAGVVRVDMKGMIRELTQLPVEACLTHSDGDHTANLEDFDCVWAHGEEIPWLALPPGGPEIKEAKDGQLFDLGGMTLKVLHTPGHTPGSLSLLDEAGGILFAGDMVSYGPVYMFGEKRDMERYLETMGKLKEMAGAGVFKKVFPCHNTCPVGPETIDELIARGRGILDGSLTGQKPQRDFGGREVLEYRVGKSGIYYDAPRE